MTCAACQHPEREDLDIRLAQGSPLDMLHTMFGVSVAVLKQHQEEHLRNLPVKIRTDPSSVLLTLEQTEQDVRTVIEMARGVKDSETGDYIIKPSPKLMLDASDRMIAIQVTAVKLAKELAMFKKDVVSRDTFRQMIETVRKALEPFPGALDAVDAALAVLPL